MVVILTVYFLLIIAGTLLFLSPVRFGPLQAGLDLTRAALRGAWQRATSSCQVTARHSRHHLHRAGAWPVALVRNRPFTTLAAAGLLLAPSLFVLAVRGPTVFEFDGARTAPDTRIAMLLDGEHLVPPAPLPPEVFTTREVEQFRPGTALADRRWDRLDPEFAQRLLRVFKEMRERHGYEMVLLEGFRSPQRQAELAALGPHVTQAGPNMSYHQYGLAADAAFLRDGRVVISERDPWAQRGYELYGEIAAATGLEWGGRWQMRDLGHIELPRKGVRGSPGA